MATVKIRERLRGGIHGWRLIHVRHEGHIMKKAVYRDIVVQIDGIQNVLGMWIGEGSSGESAKFWDDRRLATRYEKKLSF